ncbi:FAD-dependent monooxygenase [Marinagarivorans algicola]|uniref:FAD-dependent monooxygenase n=1 Tax=Marinagarivorans algicola TaxID=1513270 RepID=UPI0006B9715F|nr:FAD-dependent monooxygenase [Marinagarivorans algicola]
MAIQTDIAIVGGALAGATLALALAKHTQWRITLITGSALPSANLRESAEEDIASSRVVALNETSLRFLTQLGINPLAQPHTHCTYRDMHVWDGEGTGEVNFSASDNHVERLGVIAQSEALVSELLQGVAGQSRIQMIANNPVVAFSEGNDGVKVIGLSSGERVKANLVVAADGAHSFIRDAANIPVQKKPYGQSAIVATVELERGHNAAAYQCFSSDGPLAFLPLPSVGDKHYCAIVWSQDNNKAHALSQLDDSALALALERGIEKRLGRVLGVYHRALIPLLEQHAEQYGTRGVVLVGDAAHTLHPLAGQGVNLGFADVSVLVDELGRAERRGLSVQAPCVVTRYQRRRKLHNAAAIKAMALFKMSFEQRSPYFTLLRNTGMHIFNQSTHLKKRAMALAAGTMI